MDLVRLERVFVPVLVLLLCGLLAFLTFWRVDNFGAKGRWSEFVESSPAVIKDASARAETASSFIEDATAAGFKPEEINELKENADEVAALTRELKPVLDFVSETDESGASDMNFLASVSKNSAKIRVDIPADFKVQHEKLRKIRTKLEVKSDALLDQVNGLLLEFSDEKARLDTGWKDALAGLSQTMAESQEVLDLSDLYILDSEQNKTSLEAAIKRAQSLLDGAQSRPVVFADAQAQIASYNSATQKMSDAAEALHAEMVEIDNRPVIVVPEPVTIEEDEPNLPVEQPSSSPTSAEPSTTTPTTAETKDPEPTEDPEPTAQPTVDPTDEAESVETGASQVIVSPDDPTTGTN